MSSLLCRNETAMSTSYDFTTIIDHAFDQISKRSVKRAEYYQIVSSFIKHHKCSKLSSIIERFPTFVEAAVSDDVEAQAVVILIQETLNNGSTDVITLFTKGLSKLVSTSCKTATKNPDSDLGLLVLEVLGKSKLRSHMVPNSKVVCQTCLQLLDRPSANRPLLSSVFSLFVSIESPENWAAHWLAVTDECSRSLTLLDICSASKQKQVFAAQPLLPALPASKLRGASKALHVSNAFEGLCAILKEVIFPQVLWRRHV